MKCFILFLCFASIATARDIRWKDQNSDSPSERIVSGSEAEPHSRPFQVGIFLNKDDKTSMCGGSLIKRNFVLTAAQCVGDGKTTLNVVLGAHNIDDDEDKLEVHSSAIYIHPNFNPKNLENDLALIKLPGEVEITNNVQVVYLPPQSSVGSSFNNLEATVAGWGKTSDGGSVSAVLQETRMKVITNSKCNIRFQGTIKDNQICTNGADKKSICSGDFGGPLTLLHKGRMTQIGIASFTMELGCETGWPPVFTRVAKYLDWISEVSGLSILP